MWSRRDILQLAAALGATALPRDSAGQQPPAYWQQVRAAFDLDDSLINLNNGNSSPSPRLVHQAFTGYLDATNRLPAYYRGLLEERLGRVRAQLAAAVGCAPEELAFTRNATEALHIAQCGVQLQRGDEVLTTDQDYTRMLWAWDQRARRDGIIVRRVQFPVPSTADVLLDRLASAMTSRTRVVHICHVTNPTGQLFPVREICRLARERGIISIVDGAQALGHFPFAIRDLDCDVYGASLHKWLMAPHGTGLLFVRRERIPEIWPLMPALDAQRADINKFEEIGTHPVAARVAIADALAFHETVGPARKAARLHELTRRWMRAVEGWPRLRLLSSPDPTATWGIASVSVDGMSPHTIVQRLLDRHRIVVSAVTTQGQPGPVLDYAGIRISPNVYTTEAEIDRLIEALDEAVRNA